MMRSFPVAVLTFVSCLGACDMPVRSQVPTHVAEFTMPTTDYAALLAALDSTAMPFGLKRVGAAPGLKELHGREVLFAAYEPLDPKEWRGALEVNDINGPGNVLLRVYGDYFDDAELRSRFLSEVSNVIRRFGGTLKPIRTKGES